MIDSKYARTVANLLLSATLGSASMAVAAVQAAANGVAEHPLSDIATTALREMERRAANQHFDNVEVQVRALDARLGLAQCGQALRVLPDNVNRAIGPVSVGIRCEGPQPWTLYVRGQVSAEVTVPVMAVSVGRGDILGRGDIELQKRRITRDLGPIISEIDDIAGKEARRNLRPGATLSYADLRLPELVKRGEMVTLVSGGGGLQVSMQGKAMSSGAAGDRILVTNLSSGKRVEGRIALNGLVVLD